jgi:hypothetical protein
MTASWNTKFLLTLWLMGIIIINKGENRMENNKSSEINNFPVILLADVTQASPSDWSRDSTNPLNQFRYVQLVLQIIEKLKGDESYKADQKFGLKVTQKRPLSGRYSDDYGPWSTIDLEKKPRILIFSDKFDINKSGFKIDESCGFVVQIPNPNLPFALEDVRLAMWMSQQSVYPNIFNTNEIYKKLLEQSDRTGPLLARFVLDAVEQNRTDLAIKRLIEIIQNPNLAGLFRSVLLTYLSEHFSMNSEDVPEELHIAFIRAMTGILSEESEDSAVLKEGICQAYLYNAVFAETDTPYFPAEKVFEADTTRADAAKTIEERPMEPDMQTELLNWLER